MKDSCLTETAIEAIYLVDCRRAEETRQALLDQALKDKMRRLEEIKITSKEPKT